MAQERITRSNTIQFQPLSIYFQMESEAMCSSPLPITLNSLPLPYLTGYNCIIYLYWVARECRFFCKRHSTPRKWEEAGWEWGTKAEVADRWE